MLRVPTAILLVGVVWAAGPAAEPAPTALPGSTQVVGHRGLVRHAPEETMADFDACIDLRVSFELDVRKTRDGQLVCLHDDTVDRTTNGRGKVADLSLREVQKLEAGRKFDPTFTGERVPTLDEVFARVKERKATSLTVAVDLKAPGVEEECVRLAEKHGVLPQLVFIGLAIEHPEVREKVQSASPKAACAVLCPAVDKLSEAIADKTATWVYVRFIPTPGQVKQVHAAGKKVFLAGPLVIGNEPANWARCRDVGVDAILTDYPLECRAGWRDGKK